MMGEIADLIANAEQWETMAEAIDAEDGERGPSRELIEECWTKGVSVKICPVCGKRFRRVSGEGYGIGDVDLCSWPCQREAEKKSAAFWEKQKTGINATVVAPWLREAQKDRGRELAIARQERARAVTMEARRLFLEGWAEQQIIDAIGRSQAVRLARRELEEETGRSFRMKAGRKAKYTAQEARKKNKERTERSLAMSWEEREKNREKARELLRAGRGWQEILREAHVGAKTLAEIRREVEAEQARADDAAVESVTPAESLTVEPVAQEQPETAEEPATEEPDGEEQPKKPRVATVNREVEDFLPLPPRKAVSPALCQPARLSGVSLAETDSAVEEVKSAEAVRKPTRIRAKAGKPITGDVIRNRKAWDALGVLRMLVAYSGMDETGAPDTMTTAGRKALIDLEEYLLSLEG